MTDLPTLRTSTRILVLLLALGLTAMLAVSLIDRFKNPQLTVQLSPRARGAWGDAAPGSHRPAYAAGRPGSRQCGGPGPAH